MSEDEAWGLQKYLRLIRIRQMYRIHHPRYIFPKSFEEAPQKLLWKNPPLAKLNDIGVIPKRSKIGTTLNNFLIVQKTIFEWIYVINMFIFGTHQLEIFNGSFFAVGRKQSAQFHSKIIFCTSKKIIQSGPYFWPFQDMIKMFFSFALLLQWNTIYSPQKFLVHWKNLKIFYS